VGCIYVSTRQSIYPIDHVDMLLMSLVGLSFQHATSPPAPYCSVVCGCYVFWCKIARCAHIIMLTTFVHDEAALVIWLVSQGALVVSWPAADHNSGLSVLQPSVGGGSISSAHQCRGQDYDCSLATSV
jgi:hypothetical protein